MEPVRQMVRGVLGSRSPVYRRAARAYSGARTVLKEGLGAHNRLKHVRNAPVGDMIPISLKSLDHPIWMRTGTDDPEVVIQNAVRDEWGVAYGYGHAPRTMIDGGAFIGDSAAVFLSRYPELFVVAMEPDERNYAMTERNLAPYGERVRLLKAALWHEDATLNFGGESWGAAIGKQGVEVAAVAIADVIADLPGGRVDILKLDIEGAELELFVNAPERWIDRVDTILIELHGKAIADKVMPVIASHGFSVKQHRSVWCCSRAD